VICSEKGLSPLTIRTAIVLTCLSVSGCWTGRDFPTKFAEWEKRQEESRLKACWGPSPDDLKLERSLGAWAHLHESFLIEKLRANFSVYGILDASPTLRRKYGVPPIKSGVVAICPCERQELWLKAMGVEGPFVTAGLARADVVGIHFVDPKGSSVPNVGVGPRGEASAIGQSPVGNGDYVMAFSDANGRAFLDYAARAVGKKISLYALQAERRLAGTWQLPGDWFGNLVTLKLRPARRVTGRATCSVWQDRGLPVPRTWLSVRKGGREVACYGPACPDFEFFLPAGRYELEVRGQEVISRTVPLEVGPGSQELAVATIDLVPTKLGSLFGTPAPELDRIKDWVQGPAVKLADLRGRHVLLYFCRWGRWGPDGYDLLRLMEISDAFTEKQLKVIILANRPPPIEELRPLLGKIAATLGRPLPCAVAVDAGTGVRKVLRHDEVEIGATFLAYGVFGRDVTNRTLLVDPVGKLIKSCDLVACQQFITEFAKSLGTRRRTPGWVARLKAVYGLAEGEVLKHVPPPFIPERRIFRMQSLVEHDAVHSGWAPDIMREIIYMYWEWDGRVHGEYGGATAWSLRYLLGVRSADLAGPAELLDHDLSADWVFRRGASLNERHRALETYLRKKFDLAIRIEERLVGKEVVVARGKFALRPLAAARRGDLLHVYTSEAFSEPDHPVHPLDIRKGTLHQFLLSQDCVGLGLDHVVDETDSPDVKIKWLYPRSWNSAPLRTDATRLARYLDVIARQTSLRLTRERRPTKTWYVDRAR